MGFQAKYFPWTNGHHVQYIPFPGMAAITLCTIIIIAAYFQYGIQNS